MAARAGAHKLQIGDIRTRNQQHQCNRAKENQYRDPSTAGKPLSERFDGKSRALKHAAVHHWVVVAAVLLYCTQFGLCLRKTCAGAHPSEYLDDPVSTSGET